MRPKWDERHPVDGAAYGEMTIYKALGQVRMFGAAVRPGRYHARGTAVPGRS